MNPKLLFIDDDPIIHALYTPHLRRAGYEVIGLTEAEQAVLVATKEQPEAVIMDMVLPGQDGLTTILQLKTAQPTRHIPIIAVSANTSLSIRSS
jgi:CheY-like chemotaxis protein